MLWETLRAGGVRGDGGAGMGNLPILGTREGNTIEKHTQGSTQNSTDTLKQPKGSK